MEPALVPLRCAVTSPPQLLDPCIGWRKQKRIAHPISYVETLLKTGSESIEATLRKRQNLFAGFFVHMEDTRPLKCEIFGELRRGGRKWS